MADAPPSLREWVREHDEKWLFVVLYLGLAVGLSVLVSLFWLVVVGFLHFVLELFRQAHYRDGPRSVTLHALWEVKLDIALILLALMLVLYIEVVLGLLGIQSAARAAAVSRAGARVGTRAAAWERNLRTFLLTVDEMVRVGYAGVMLRKKKRSKAVEAELAVASAAAVQDGAAGFEGGGVDSDSASAPAPEPTDQLDPGPIRTGPLPPIWRTRWKVVDHIGVVLVLVGLLLIAAAPWLTPHDWGSIGTALLEELQPFPGSSPHGG
ncbi:MAG: hypothetical protein EA351_15205 [Gemmatimonadales bacterium]|nr:MAG: hypothetical protein EA351_15205 [Gemmatimonadales bacterium]